MDGSTNGARHAGNHALVFGASGIHGWAVVNELLNGFPTADSFATVTALTNRPVRREATLWPASDKLQLVSGLDLLGGTQAELESALLRGVAGVDGVTHVFFGAYMLDLDAAKEVELNRALLARAVTAAEHLSPRLRFVVLPTGTKHYGINVPDEYPFCALPLEEADARVPEPHASLNFYFAQLEWLRGAAAGKAWTFCHVIPDLIIGFVPNDNFYNTAQALARYFSLVRAVEGAGATVVFPGNERAWAQRSNDTSQDVLARFCIWAALHPETTAGETYNVADDPAPSSWGAKWETLCAYFGLRGAPPPPDGASQRGPDPGAYLREHEGAWRRLEREHGLRESHMGHSRDYGFMIGALTNVLTADRHMSLDKSHRARGKDVEVRDTRTTWYTAFDRMRAAKIIP